MEAILTVSLQQLSYYILESWSTIAFILKYWKRDNCNKLGRYYKIVFSFWFGKKEFDKKLLRHQVDWLVSVGKYLSQETSRFLEFI